MRRTIRFVGGALIAAAVVAVPEAIATQGSQTALCDAVAQRVRADADVMAGTRTVWSLVTKAPTPIIEVATPVSALALERNPEPEVRWLFEKRLRSFYGNGEAVLKDLQQWDDFDVFALPDSAVRMVLRTGGTAQCESRYFFRVTTSREFVRMPDPPDKSASDVANAICENNGAWGYFGRIHVRGGADAFVEYRISDADESLRIVPLEDAEWQPACTVTTHVETSEGGGRKRTMQVIASK